MNLGILGIKGGTGKTTIAKCFAARYDYPYITNDLVGRWEPKYVQIEHSLKRIPAALCRHRETVYDFGAMSTHIDPKIAHLAKLAHAFVLPTKVDYDSLMAVIETYKLVQPIGKPIVIVINDVFKDVSYNNAVTTLRCALGQGIIIKRINRTTLAQRLCEDGINWLANIHNDKGTKVLKKTWSNICRVLEEIHEIAERHYEVKNAR